MRQGRVEVNGEVCRELGSKVDPAEDEVRVDDTPVTLPDEMTYLMLHKPTGVITSTEDPQGRRIVLDLLPDSLPRVWPVGRLDLDSSGALLLTNDGKLTHRLTHPSYEAEKHYEILVDGRVGNEDAELQRMRNGMTLPSGEALQPAEVEVIKHHGGRTRLAVTLTEGKKRQIRRMFEAFDHPVLELKRTGMGPVGLGDLEQGAWRHLRDEEITALYAEVGLEGP